MKQHVKRGQHVKTSAKISCFCGQKQQCCIEDLTHLTWCSCQQAHCPHHFNGQNRLTIGLKLRFLICRVTVSQSMKPLIQNSVRVPPLVDSCADLPANSAPNFIQAPVVLCRHSYCVKLKFKFKGELSASYCEVVIVDSIKAGSAEQKSNWYVSTQRTDQEY